MALELTTGGLRTVGTPGQQVGAVLRRPIVTRRRRGGRIVRRRDGLDKRPRVEPPEEIKEELPTVKPQIAKVDTTPIKPRERNVGNLHFRNINLGKDKSRELVNKVLSPIVGGADKYRSGRAFSLRYLNVYGGVKLNNLIKKTKWGQKLNKKVDSLAYDTKTGRVVASVVTPITKEAITWGAISPFTRTTTELKSALLSKELRRLGTKKQSGTIGVTTSKGKINKVVTGTKMKTKNFELQSANTYEVQQVGNKLIIKKGVGITKIINKKTGKSIGKPVRYTFFGKGKNIDKVRIPIKDTKNMLEVSKGIKAGKGDIKILTKDLKVIKKSFGGMFRNEGQIQKAVLGDLKKIVKGGKVTKWKKWRIIEDTKKTGRFKKEDVAFIKEVAEKKLKKAFTIKSKGITKAKILRDLRRGTQKVLRGGRKVSPERTLNKIDNFIKQAVRETGKRGQKSVKEVLINPTRQSGLSQITIQKVKQVQSNMDPKVFDNIVSRETARLSKAGVLKKLSTTAVKPVILPSKTKQIPITKKKFVTPTTKKVQARKLKKQLDTKQTSKVRQRSGEGTRTDTKQESKTREETRQISETITRQRERTEQKSKKAFPRPRTKQVQKSRLKPIVRVTPKGRPKLPIPFLKGKKKKRKMKAVVPKKKKGYNAYAKARKRLIKINKKPLSKAGAKNRMAYGVDNTTSRTGKIKAVGKVKKLAKVRKKEVGYYSKTKRKFRRKGKRYIEKRKHAIDTKGEKKGLTLAKFKKGLNSKKPTRKKRKRR